MNHSCACVFYYMLFVISTINVINYYYYRKLSVKLMSLRVLSLLLLS